MLLELRISSFDTILMKSRFKFDALWSHSNNTVISHLCTLGLYTVSGKKSDSLNNVR